MPRSGSEGDRRRHSRSRRRDRDRRRSRSRRRTRRSRSASRSPTPAATSKYVLNLLAGENRTAMKKIDVRIDDSMVQHVCAMSDEVFRIRVQNNTRRHIACMVKVDGVNAILKDGSLIVAPKDERELPGFLVSKNFVGREYVKEYRNFVFGKPKVVDTEEYKKEKEKRKRDAAPGSSEAADREDYKDFGRITCEVYKAELDEEVSSDEDMRGQVSHYRQGLHGSGNDNRLIPEGKKTHMVFSSVTVSGARSSISNSTRGRWWVRSNLLLETLEVRYRETHSLMLLGVDPNELGVKSSSSRVKKEEVKKEEFQKVDIKQEGVKRETKCEMKEEKAEIVDELPRDRRLQVCDLTLSDEEDVTVWTTAERHDAPAVSLD